MVLELEQEYGSVITPMALAHPLHPIRSSRAISAETCRGGDVSPPDDLGSGPYTQFIIIYIYFIIAAF